MILSVLSSLALVSGLMVVRAKNPVHSVLFPIPVFRNTSGLLLLLGLDFFAMIFPVVHIGAIAVSFLFVVMMFHIQIAEIHEEVLRYLPDGRVITTLAFVLEFPLASLTSLSLALPPFTTMAVSLSTGARIRLKVGSRFLVESIGSSIRADLLNASAVQSSAADGLVVADGLLLAIESTLTARVDGLLGDPSMLSPIITSNYIQESHLPDVVSGPGDLLAPSCFNGRGRGLKRDIRAKKKGLQPQGVASVPDNRSRGVVRPLLLQLRNYLVVRGNSNPRLLHSPKPQNRHLAEALGGEGVSLLVYPRLIGNGKPGECYQLPLLPRWKAYELD
ncbi:hypothetical protein L1987_88571 [Smallanthus sonchifolius]|nr:hypothetical protein L1987_89791 [Smallanthus sonchifolius]KAI3664769.1 hypothetical protein L1987_89448 [Smallanthus sonchifolius]KAI3668439.1 hypothetical protein L1987_88571 [Smallanthus sonchifolius]